MKLTHFDRALIHGLGLMSRPPIIPQPQDHRMLAEIVTLAAERSQKTGPMADLVEAARHAHADDRIFRGTAYLIERAMDDFDRVLLGVHWDAARGQK